MPARTGTDGRGGRLRAVHATASASTSRASRNFMTRPTPALPVLARTPSSSLRCGISRASCGLIVPGAVQRRETLASGDLPDALFPAFPTETGVGEFLEITPSSSSSHVWKLGTEPLPAGQPPSRHVGPL